MFRTALVATAVSLTVFGAQAEKPERDPRVTEMLQHLPSQADVKDMTADMPDFNRLITGMIDIAEDKETRNTLERLAARLEGRFETLASELEATPEGEIPDINGTIEDVLLIATEEDTMADVLTLFFRVTDLVEETVEDANLERHD